MKYVNWYFILILYLFGFVFISLLNPYFWFDEAGQIFMSLGLNHFSEPNSKIGSFFDVIKNNNSSNLDPGGFSIILFFWLKISTNYVWIRFLPYLFFIISVFLFVKISDIIHKNKNNIVYGLFIFIIPQLLFRSSEIRAYTMEFLSILVSIYIIINLDKLNNKNIFLLSLISSILITSRYSSVLLFGIITLITIYYTLLISTKSFYNKFITILLFSMPLFISVCFIFFGTLIHQNPNLSKVTYMEYLNDNPLLFFKNFNWIHFVSILLLIFIAFFDQKINLPLKFFLYSAIVVNLVFILISFLGIYPYNPFDERNLAIFVYAFLPLIYWFHLKFNKYVIFLKKPFIPLFFAIIFTYTFNKVVSKNWRKNNLYTDLVNYKFSKQNIFFVEKDLIPTTRYLFEYTNLNNHLDYPNSFLFLINDSIIDETIRLKKNSNCFLISNRIIYNNKFKKVGYSLYKVN